MNSASVLLSPEALLVLMPSRGGEARARIGALLEQVTDWQTVVRMADRERNTLPLWRAIREGGWDTSRSELQVLKRLAGVWEFKLMHLERMLLQTVDALSAAGIQPVLLKGAAAAVSVYGGFSERPMLDLDILMSDEEAMDAWSRSQECGWRWDSAEYPLEAYRHAHHLPPLGDEFGSGSALEIHRAIWMPDNPFTFTTEDLRERAIQVTIEGRTVRIPRISDQLLHCCIHFAWSHRLRSHGWRAFSDVDAFVASGRIDWADFVGTAKQTGADTSAYWTLRLAGSLGGVPVPEVVLRDLRPVAPEFLLSRLERHFALNLLPSENVCPSLALEKRLWQLALRRGAGSEGIDLPSAPRRKTLREKAQHHLARTGEWVSYLRRIA